MISAWMSLIRRRSAARLYSICSICVRGITCLSCTCVCTPNKPLKIRDKSTRQSSALSHIFIFLDLSSFGSPGNKGGKGVANLPLPVRVEVLTGDQDAHLTRNKQSSPQSSLKAHELPRCPKGHSTNLHAGREGSVDLRYDIDNFSNP